MFGRQQLPSTRLKKRCPWYSFIFCSFCFLFQLPVISHSIFHKHYHYSHLLVFLACRLLFPLFLCIYEKGSTDKAILGAQMNPVSIVSVSASDWVNQMATTIFLTPNSILRNSFDCGHALQFLCSNHKFRSRQIFLRKCYGSRGGFSLNRGFRLFCQSKVISKYPFHSQLISLFWLV